MVNRQWRPNRRRLLGSAVAVVAATVGGTWLSRAAADPAAPFFPSRAHDQPTIPGISVFSYKSPNLTKFVDPLTILPRRRLGGDIVAGLHQHRFHRDLPEVASWGFDGVTHLGPILEVRRGEIISTRFVNDLRSHVLAADVDTTLHGALEIDRTEPPLAVHLHGAPNRPEFDGYPTSVVRPGQSVEMTFGNDLDATTLWYHDHSMGTSRLSIYSGLAAPYFVRDDWDTGEADNPLGLPSGTREIPLMVCDKLFYDDGRLRYDNTPTVQQGHWAGGLCGDVMVVNGKAWPYLDVDRGVYRFRLISSSQLNDYRLALSNGEPFWVIGSDGGLLDAPVMVGELDIAPAERYDLLIDFSRAEPGTAIDLVNTMQISIAGQANGAMAIRDVMRFVVGESQAPVRTVPHTLRRSATAVPGTPQSVRTATLSVNANTENPTFLGVLGMSLNNMRFDQSDFDMPVQGTTEQWDFVNADATFQVHSMHVHLVQFKVLGRQDFDKVRYLAENPPPLLGTRWTPSADEYTTNSPEPPAPYESGWKDTVRCPPNQITRILVRWPTVDELGFDPDAEFTGPDGTAAQGYVWHCHLTDHEDNEMMQRLRVVSAEGAAPSSVTHGAGGHHH
ncbi:multicopper oxidase domain-containing protein [Rhodococcoides fascians A25f]|uniref:multicopper oxidase family protein n=1 Tax=Rhodococcoides fascians TaxID=1828 RepID=UPI00068ECD28|nr:multicopper oxidase domain-containing protein [Rhodococcus fascians]QII07177.1 multicopper oxidase domain-containing protein [Rhodococcus fascians A25f]